MADNPTQQTPTERYNARLGVVLFLVYVLFYGLFVAMSAFRLDIMAKPFLAGVNLAVVYGFALIIGAFLMALLYMALCKSEQTSEETE